jgi:O-antigen ligase
VDTALTLGLPGLVLLVLALVIGPLRDFGRVDSRGGEKPLALLFLRIWLFGVSLSAFESIFFERADPIWFTFLVAVFGLRYLGRFRTAA